GDRARGRRRGCPRRGGGGPARAGVASCPGPRRWCRGPRDRPPRRPARGPEPPTTAGHSPGWGRPAGPRTAGRGRGRGRRARPPPWPGWSGSRPRGRAGRGSDAGPLRRRRGRRSSSARCPGPSWPARDRGRSRSGARTRRAGRRRSRRAGPARWRCTERAGCPSSSAGWRGARVSGTRPASAKPHVRTRRRRSAALRERAQRAVLRRGVASSCGAGAKPWGDILTRKVRRMPAQAFPEGFTWGTATAAHQVDGGTWNNDWWAWEHDPRSPCVEPSGDAIDHWNRWPDDLKLLADLGFGAYRFSLEWSRIEPEEGEFSRAALDHYRAVCEGCRELGMQPVVTFHHFTSPRWLAAQDGWANPVTAERFARYCARAASELGDLMAAACTINEPNVVSFYGYRGGVFPPGERSSERRHQANHVFIEGHRRAVEAIRAAAPGVPVGLTLSM